MSAAVSGSPTGCGATPPPRGRPAPRRGGSSLTWTRIAGELAAEHRVYARLPGPRLSDWPGHYSFELFRDDLHAFLEARNLAGPPSWGTPWEGWRLPPRRAEPGLIGRLVIEDAPPLLPLDPPARPPNAPKASWTSTGRRPAHRRPAERPGPGSRERLARSRWADRQRRSGGAGTSRYASPARRTDPAVGGGKWCAEQQGRGAGRRVEQPVAGPAARPGRGRAAADPGVRQLDGVVDAVAGDDAPARRGCSAPPSPARCMAGRRQQTHARGDSVTPSETSTRFEETRSRTGCTASRTSAARLVQLAACPVVHSVRVVRDPRVGEHRHPVIALGPVFHPTWSVWRWVSTTRSTLSGGKPRRLQPLLVSGPLLVPGGLARCFPLPMPVSTTIRRPSV